VFVLAVRSQKDVGIAAEDLLTSGERSLPLKQAQARSHSLAAAKLREAIPRTREPSTAVSIQTSHQGH
jgi:hypothetical protein